MMVRYTSTLTYGGRATKSCKHFARGCSLCTLYSPVANVAPIPGMFVLMVKTARSWPVDSVFRAALEDGCCRERAVHRRAALEDGCCRERVQYWAAGRHWARLQAGAHTVTQGSGHGPHPGCKFPISRYIPPISRPISRIAFTYIPLHFEKKLIRF